MQLHPLLQLQNQRANEAPGIPQFYFPDSSKADDGKQQQMHASVQEYLHKCERMDTMKLDELRGLAKQVLKLPMSLVYSLLQKLGLPVSDTMPVAPLLEWLHTTGFWKKDETMRAFDVLRQDSCSYVSLADLKRLLSGILALHPGLTFLQESPEFQDRCDSYNNIVPLACIPTSLTIS
jgi:hypothetical protein